VKGNDNIVLSRAKGKSKRRLVKCQEDEEVQAEQPVVVRGEAEDARFEEYDDVPDDDELLWVGPSS